MTTIDDAGRPDVLSRESRDAAARRSRRAAARSHPWWFALPALVVFGAAFLVPNLLNFVYPFTNWSAFHPQISSAGLANFRTILDDGTMVTAIRVTLVYAVLVAVFQNGFGLLLALLLEKDTRTNRLLRAAFFLPVLISALAVGYIFQAFLATDGALNRVISALVGHDVAVAWLGSTTWTLVVVTLIHAWKWMGLAMLVYLAGLKTVPEDLTAAAMIDGAGSWQTFRSVRFPLLAPAVTFNVTTALIGSMNTFDIVQATTKGGPAQSTQVFNVYMFRIFGQGLYAQASAMSLVLLLVVIVLAVPLVLWLRRRENVL